MEILAKEIEITDFLAEKDRKKVILGKQAGMSLLEGRIDPKAYTIFKKRFMMMNNGLPTSEVCFLSDKNNLSKRKISGIFETEDKSVVAILSTDENGIVSNNIAKYNYKTNTLKSFTPDDTMSLVEAVAVVFGNYFNPKYTELVKSCFESFGNESIDIQKSVAAVTTGICFITASNEYDMPFTVETYDEEELLSEKFVSDLTLMYDKSYDKENELIKNLNLTDVKSIKMEKPKPLSITDVTLDTSEQTPEEKEMVDNLKEEMTGYIACAEDRMILKRIKDGGLGAQGVLLQGGPGTGKTEFVKWASTMLGIPLVPVTCAPSMDLESFFGYVGIKSTVEEGQVLTNTELSEGPVVSAIKRGYALLLDEINALPEDCITAINGLIGSKSRMFTVPKSGETIMIHPNFRLFGTFNYGTQYNGTAEMNPATLSRCIIYKKELMKIDIVKQIIRGSITYPVLSGSNIVDVVAEMYLDLMKTLEELDCDTVMSTRNCVMLVDFYNLMISTNPSFAKDKAFLEASKYAVLPHLVMQAEEDVEAKIAEMLNNFSRKVK